MSTPQLIILIGVACICGGCAVLLMGSSKSNFGANSLIALVGAYLGHWIQFRMQLPYILPITYQQVSYEFVWSMLGGFLFIFLLRFAHGSEF
jgi:uncharacterized membrane protein YeaQ/YmgE (transglycosylase-associated protein family)